MKAVIALVLLSALAVQGRELTATDGPGFWFSCKAATGLAIKVRFGSCSGSTSASCRAVVKSMQKTATQFKIFQSDKVCDSGSVTAFAKAIAEAIAKVWVSAAVRVNCQGVGNFACGWSFAEGRAWAHSFAQALATAVSEVWTHKGYTVCYADIHAIADVIASAAASAQADACTTGGPASDMQKAFAKSIVKAIAKATATATSNLCSGKGEFIAASRCYGRGESTSSKSESSSPGGSTGGGQLKPCVGAVAKCCRKGVSKCFVCKGCGVWFRSKEIGRNGRRIYKKIPSRPIEQCICDADGH